MFFLSLFSSPILFLKICDHSLIGDLGDETVDSSGIRLPLVAIVAPGDGILGDSSNYEEIANVPRCIHWPRGHISPGLAGWLIRHSGILGNGILLLLNWKRARGGI